MHAGRGNSERLVRRARVALVDLNRDELLWISNALNDVVHGPAALDDWEFHNRIGGERHEVQALLRKVRGRWTNC
jgi:hypothetical protein